MPGSKQRSTYRKKRARVFAGRRKQEVALEESDGNGAALGHVSTPSSSTAHSPPKRNRSEEKINENCPLIMRLNEAVVIRRRALELGIDSQSKKVVKSHGNHIISSSCLQQEILSAVICASCQNSKGKLQLLQDNSKQTGVHETFILRCTHCHHEFTFDTGNKLHHGHSEINVRLIQAGLLTGIGQTGLQKFCSTLDLPPPLTPKAYNAVVKEIQSSVEKECEKSLKAASLKLKEFMKATDPKCADLDFEDDIFPVAVSVDGTWQKRYGFSSLLGVIFVISMDRGEVLDYEVKSKVCFKCRSRSSWPRDSDKFLHWYEAHKQSCNINHILSAEAMEKEAAVDIFTRSVMKQGLKYTTYVGDGDSSSYREVADAMFRQFGEEYLVVKEDCVGHIQKRMGTSLRKYKSQKKGSKLQDGFSVGGRGRLSDAVIDTFQNHYGSAIRKNSQDINEMQKAILAIFYHSILGKNEDLLQQHRFCPQGSESWCKFQRDCVSKTSTYSSAKCLPSVFRDELSPIFERLSSKTLLQRCMKGFTQNQNEALNNMLWAKCPKRVFVGRTKLESAVGSSVLLWNKGAASMGSVLEAVGIKDLGFNTAAGYRSENKVRIQNMTVKCNSKYRKRRKELRQARKKRNVTGVSYLSGGFLGVGKVVERTAETHKNSNEKTAITTGDEIKIHFVDERDVVLKIHQENGK